MKILYLAPKIYGEGGLARVLSIKTNYLIEKYKYQVEIISQNQDDSLLFFEFNSAIKFHNIPRSNGMLRNYISYRKLLNKLISEIKPDFIVVCDFGYKGFLTPVLISTKIPTFFEAHGSLYNESEPFKDYFVFRFGHKLKYMLRSFCAKKFEAFIVLSNDSLKEWDVKNSFVIPNPNWINTQYSATLKSKKVIIVARHSYEKGLDRLLKIWKIVSVSNPDWVLEIFGKKSESIDLKALANKLNISSSVTFFEPQKDIVERYLGASIYVMTSRSEGLPMVLIEAMSCGLPVVAFDCPIGPRAIIDSNKNGFLIQDENYDDFIEKLELLMQNYSLRAKIGACAKESVSKYKVDVIMDQWNNLFQNFSSN